jgi:hypothetical protein
MLAAMISLLFGLAAFLAFASVLGSILRGMGAAHFIRAELAKKPSQAPGGFSIPAPRCRLIRA